MGITNRKKVDKYIIENGNISLMIIQDVIELLAARDVDPKKVRKNSTIIRNIQVDYLLAIYNRVGDN